MPRPPADQLTGADAVDLRPVRSQDELGILASLAAIIHWADSPAVRLDTMRAVDFPVEDMPLFLVVNQLAYRGAMRPTQLAEALGTGRANITKITRRLVGLDLVVLTADPDDRRGVIVALSAAGRATGARIIDLAHDRVAAGFSSWDDDDVRLFASLLRKAAAGARGQGYQPVALSPGAATA